MASETSFFSYTHTLGSQVGRAGSRITLLAVSAFGLVIRRRPPALGTPPGRALPGANWLLS